MLPPLPASDEPVQPPVQNPDEIVDLPSPFAEMPAQQPPFYDGCERLLPAMDGGFATWMTYAMTAEGFRPSDVVEALAWCELPDDVGAAYDAPFPSRIYMAGPRTFPSLINDVPGTTDEAWAGLRQFDKPFLTLWASNDPGNLGQCQTQQFLIDEIPGAAGQPHDRLPDSSHFLQDDQGTEIAQRMIDWWDSLATSEASE
jgi:haloalkane dehalogenase